MINTIVNQLYRITEALREAVKILKEIRDLMKEDAHD